VVWFFSLYLGFDSRVIIFATHHSDVLYIVLFLYVLIFVIVILGFGCYYYQFVEDLWFSRILSLHFLFCG